MPVITSLTGLVQQAVDSSYADADIKRKYENNANTNAYTDNEKALVDIDTALATNAETLPKAVNELKDTLDTKAAKSRVQAIEDKIGSADGIATLNSNGLVPTTQLPSYVDDVVEYSSTDDFPDTGEAGKIYVATDTNKTYRWGGSDYIYITSGAVDSVAGKTGVVTLTTDDIAEGNNLYYTDDRVANNSAVVANTAKETNVTTDLGVIVDASTVTVTSSDGTDAVVSAATADDAGIMIAADKSKLDGIEEGATADQTADEILTAIKTVDGVDSGLDADLLDGQQSSYYLTSNNISVTPSGNLTSSNVQSALEELQGDIDTINTVVGVD